MIKKGGGWEVISTGLAQSGMSVDLDGYSFYKITIWGYSSENSSDTYVTFFNQNGTGAGETTFRIVDTTSPVESTSGTSFKFSENSRFYIDVTLPNYSATALMIPLFGRDASNDGSNALFYGGEAGGWTKLTNVSVGRQGGFGSMQCSWIIEGLR